MILFKNAIIIMNCSNTNTGGNDIPLCVIALYLEVVCDLCVVMTHLFSMDNKDQHDIDAEVLLPVYNTTQEDSQLTESRQNIYIWTSLILMFRHIVLMTMNWCKTEGLKTIEQVEFKQEDILYAGELGSGNSGLR